MTTIQIEAGRQMPGQIDNNAILRSAGVKRIRRGWYTVSYRGRYLDRSTVAGAKRNPRGEIVEL